MNARHQEMRDRDVLFSLLLIAGSVGLIVYALRLSLEAMRAVGATFYDAPGFSILVLAGGLLVLSAALLVTALRQDGGLGWLAPSRWKGLGVDRSSRKTFVVFAYLFLYMFSFGRPIPWTRVTVPFWLSTSLFLMLTMATFRAASLRWIVVISGLGTLSVYLIFGVFAKIPLP
jgi:hypothetical protein